MILRPHDPQMWIDQLFSSKSANSGGVVRRNKDWIAREIGMDRFIHEVRERGFHLIDAGPQMIVVCNQLPLRVLF